MNIVSTERARERGGLCSKIGSSVGTGTRRQLLVKIGFLSGSGFCRMVKRGDLK